MTDAINGSFAPSIKSPFKFSGRGDSQTKRITSSLKASKTSHASDDWGRMSGSDSDTKHTKKGRPFSKVSSTIRDSISRLPNSTKKVTRKGSISTGWVDIRPEDGLLAAPVANHRTSKKVVAKSPFHNDDPTAAKSGDSVKIRDMPGLVVGVVGVAWDLFKPEIFQSEVSKVAPPKTKK